MSNRKYAALLEGGPLSEEERMNGIVEDLSEHVNQLCQDIVKEEWYEQNEGLENGIQSIVKNRFKRMSPELEEKYQIVVGTTDNDGVYKVHVGFRRKWVVTASDTLYGNLTINSDDVIRAINHTHDDRWFIGNSAIQDATIGTIDASRITAGSITATTIQAGAITAGRIAATDTQRLDGLRDLPNIRINERYGVGVLNTGGQAIAARPFNTAAVWNAGNTGANTNGN